MRYVRFLWNFSRSVICAALGFFDVGFWICRWIEDGAWHGGLGSFVEEGLGQVC